MRIAVAATFTAEPLAESLAFWGEKLGWNPEIEFAGYNQVFQQLLDPSSLFATSRKSANVVLVRPEDWVRHGHDSDGNACKDKLLSTSRELITAVRAAAQRSSVPYLVCVCPSSPARAGDEILKQAEQQIVSDLRDVTGL